MTDWGIAILMHENDNVGLLTQDGKFAGICALSEQYVKENADQIQEIMIAIMKEAEHRKDLWIWKISHEWTQLRGEKIITTKGEIDE